MSLAALVHPDTGGACPLTRTPNPGRTALHGAEASRVHGVRHGAPTHGGPVGCRAHACGGPGPTSTQSALISCSAAVGEVTRGPLETCGQGGGGGAPSAAQNAQEQQRITFTPEQPQQTPATGQFVDLETCAKVPGAPGTTQLRVGQPNSHNGRQGATCCPPPPPAPHTSSGERASRRRKSLKLGGTQAAKQLGTEPPHILQ